MSTLMQLQKWYAERCNGEWEHSWGVKISTLDNPGWRVKIDLNETAKESAQLAHMKIDRSDDDWIHYWAESKQFHIACGPENLSEAIGLFIQWFESN